MIEDMMKAFGGFVERLANDDESWESTGSEHFIPKEQLAQHAAVNATDTEISVHATVHAALGIDPAKVLYAGKRPVPITDHGRPVAGVFS